MKTIDELIVDAKSIYEELLKIKESQENKNQEKQIDFEKIYATARKNALKGHIISEKDEHIQKLYCRFLASIINTTKNDELRYSQFVFLSRIIESIESPNFNTQDCLNYVLESGIDIPETLKSLDEELINMLVVDSFIICKLNNETEKDNLEYVSEFISMFNVNIDNINQKLKLVFAIISQNDNDIIQNSKGYNMNKLVSYMKNPIKDKFLYSIKELFESIEDKIILFNLDIADEDSLINLDSAKVKNIIFNKCTFRNIKGIFSRKNNIIFKDCSFIDNNTRYLLDAENCNIYNTTFENCRTTNKLINVKNGSIIDSSFTRCNAVDMPDSTYLINIYNGDMENIKISDCKVTTDNKEKRGSTYSGIVYIENGYIKNLDMTSCEIYLQSSYGRFAQFYANIVAIINGSIKDSNFEKCICNNKYVTDFGSTYYIIGLDKSSHNNCNIKNCKSEDYYWASRRNTSYIGEYKKR